MILVDGRGNLHRPGARGCAPAAGLTETEAWPGLIFLS